MIIGTPAGSSPRCRLYRMLQNDQTPELGPIGGNGCDRRCWHVLAIDAFSRARALGAQYNQRRSSNISMTLIALSA
jgi:hypothetical protein